MRGRRIVRFLEIEVKKYLETLIVESNRKGGKRCEVVFKEVETGERKCVRWGSQ